MKKFFEKALSLNWPAQIKTRFSDCNRFIRFVLKHFIQDDCTYIASALAFTSLLSVVPLMSVGLAIFSTFPAFEGFAEPLQNFIFDNFVPTTGKILQSYLQLFTSQVSKLSVWGFLFLIVTALLMLFTIEQAMNKIWRVNNGRYGVPAFLLYWSILSLAPLLIGLSIAVSSYLFSTQLLFDSNALSRIIHYSPFFLSLMGFVFLYTIVPNCRVKIRHALGGGFVAALLFETAKQGFAYYLARFDTYELVYGAFAIIPIFFIWVYWVWIITLLGAEISYAFSVHHQRRSGDSLDGFSHALLWLYELWLAQQKGKGLSLNELIDASTQPFAVDADEMICDLIRQELIHSTAEDSYMLSRDLNQISLYDLSQILPYRLPNYQELKYPYSAPAERWDKKLKQGSAQLQQSLDVSLEALFQN